MVCKISRRAEFLVRRTNFFRDRINVLIFGHRRPQIHGHRRIRHRGLHHDRARPTAINRVTDMGVQSSKNIKIGCSGGGIRCRSCLRSSTTLLHQPHSSVRTNAIFMSPAGKCQWKLSGIGLSSNPKDDNPVLYVSITLA
ncbi:hypothetical protein V8E55_010510 [Tylopilus felleus]